MQIGLPVEGSVPMLTQALPVQLPVPQVPCGLQLWSWDAPHGFGPASVAVPVVAGSRMSRGAASVAGSGGQSRERLYDLLGPSDWATTRTSSTVQALPWFGPLSHLLLLQRGHTCIAVVRWTFEVRLIWKLASPVRGLIVPMPLGEPFHWWTTQTGTLAARSGSGAPKVAPLGVPAPTDAVVSQGGVPSGPQVLRHAFSVELPTTGELCDVPVWPLSRSVPLVATTRSISFGPPAGLAFAPVQDTCCGMVVVVVMVPQLVRLGF